MRSIVTIFITATLMAMTGCSALPKNKTITPNQTSAEQQYILLDYPISIPTMVWDSKKVTFSPEGEDYARLLNKLLPVENIDVYTKISNKSGEISTTGGNANAKDNKLSSMIVYSKYATRHYYVTDDSKDDVNATIDNFTLCSDSSCKQDVRKNPITIENFSGDTIIPIPVHIGISVTVEARYRSNDAKAKAIFGTSGTDMEYDNLQGCLRVTKAGINSESISLLMVLPDEITAESVKTALLSFEKIKTLVYGRNVTITPCILGYVDNCSKNKKERAAFQEFVKLKLMAHVQNELGELVKKILTQSAEPLDNKKKKEAHEANISKRTLELEPTDMINILND